MSKGETWDPELKEIVMRDYWKGRSARELSEVTGIPAKTITQWAWNEKNAARERGEPVPEKKIVYNKGGAPKGNRNAAGSKGPSGYQNAKKHGAYAAVLLGKLSEEEEELISALPESVEEQLISQIQILTVREHRIMNALQKYYDQELYLRYRTRKKHGQVPDAGEAETDPANPVFESVAGEVTSSTEWACIDLVVRLEHELSTVQLAMNEALEILERIRQPKRDRAALILKRKLELEYLDARVENVDAKTNRILGGSLDLEDLEAVDADIYGPEG